MSTEPLLAKEQEDAVLTELAKGSSVGRACEVAGTERQTVLAHRRADIEFALRWRDAEDEATDVLEAALYHRALDATAPGSDGLLAFVLQVRMPEKFGKPVPPWSSPNDSIERFR